MHKQSLVIFQLPDLCTRSRMCYDADDASPVCAKRAANIQQKRLFPAQWVGFYVLVSTSTYMRRSVYRHVN